MDAGSSMSKIIYGWIDENKKYVVKHMSMGPECISLAPTTGEYIFNGMGIGLPEDNAWVRYEKDGEIIAIGRKARQYGAVSQIKPLKATMIVPKILAAIGAIAETEEITNKIDLDLAILLPFNEITSKKQIELHLKSALEKSFYFRDKEIKVKLDRLLIVSEAAGLALLSKALDEKNFYRTNQGFLMLGHRNTSFLLFERGSFDPVKSSATIHGFYNFIDKFKEKVPGIEREEVLKMIKTKGNVNYDWQKDVYELKDLSTHVNLSVLEDAQRSADMLKRAYQASLDEYWRRIFLWLKECVPKDLDAIWCCGGAAPFLISKIQKSYPNLKICKPTAEINSLWKAFGYDRQNYPSELLEDNLIERMIDAWGFFVIFSDYYIREEVSV